MKNKPISKPWLRFWIVCLALALVFALAAAVGFGILKDFLTELEAKNTAMENARPEVARDAYLKSLTPEVVAGRLDSLYEGLDTRLQSQETAQTVVTEALSQGIGCKLSFSSSQKQSYLLYSKNTIDGKYPQIGSFTIAPQGETVYGYTTWVVVEDSFQMDWLRQEAVSVTVPHNATVWFQDQELDDSFVTQADLPYEALAALPAEWKLPTKRVYTAGPVLGSTALEIRDAQGQTLTIDENTDWNQLLPSCSQEQQQRLEKFCKEFLNRYTRYTSTSYSMYSNLASLQELLVNGSELDKQMEGAAEGLIWIKSSPDTVKEITYNRFLPLENGKFLCDITYVVNLKGRVGSLTQTVSAQVVVTETSGSLKAENLIFY